MTDKEEFLKLMDRFKIAVGKDSVFGSEDEYYDVSDSSRIACQFVFNKDGNFLYTSCYN